jgi:hypothetical protein
VIVYNELGLAGTILAAFLSGIVVLGASAVGVPLGLEAFFLGWSLLMAAWGLAYDRVPPGQGWHVYVRANWLHEPPRETLVALFGFPLLEAPFVMLACSWFFPPMWKAPRLAEWFYVAMIVMCFIVVALAFILRKHRHGLWEQWRDTLPDNTAELLDPSLPARVLEPSVRPTPLPAPISVEDAEDRCARTRRWLRFFVILMPAGALVPCCFSALAPQGTAKMVWAAVACILPLIGLAGTLLLRKDLQRDENSLRVAQTFHEARERFAYDNLPKNDEYTDVDDFLEPEQR